jgi:Copper type II ascorbate-dependent monooxygenase, C-terminal domain/Copper type II ascorbate-dependent monooxygenase, N-terminal domain
LHSRMLLVVVGLGACGKEELSEGPAAPAWYGEVEPIVRARCQSCHQAGGIAPLDLGDYQTAATWAGAMAASVTSRTMPPWLVTDDGSCGDFRDSAWLSDAEIETLVAWADGGAPMGDVSLAISDPLPPLASLDRVDLVVATPQFVPAPVGTELATNDEYRCFLVDDPTDADGFLTGFEVVPGNEAIVHHVLLMPVDPTAPGYDGRLNSVNIEEMNGADGRDGWSCFGAAGGNIRERSVPVVWAPGSGAVVYPDGAGVEVGAQDQFVIQVHYNLADPDNAGAADQTQIKLRIDPNTEREAYMILPDLFLGSLFYGYPETLPPGEEEATFSFTASGWELAASTGIPEDQWYSGVELVGVFPHMHELGATERLEITRGDDTECAAEVTAWDFNWQLQYFYEEPILIGPDDLVTVTCTWDTRSRTEPVYPGWGTENEMCLMGMWLVP